MEDVFSDFVIVLGLLGYAPAFIGLCNSVILSFEFVRMLKRKRIFSTPLLGLSLAMFVSLLGLLWGVGEELLLPADEVIFSWKGPMVFLILLMPVSALLLSSYRIFKNKRDGSSWITALFSAPLSALSLYVAFLWIAAGLEYAFPYLKSS